MHTLRYTAAALALLAFQPVYAEETKAETTEAAKKSDSSDPIGDDCKFKGQKLNGKVQVVDSFPDYKVKVVTSFPDLKVKVVSSFPDDCGEWQFVDSFPDFKIQYVESFPDFKIKMVESFPGVP